MITFGKKRRVLLSDYYEKSISFPIPSLHWERGGGGGGGGDRGMAEMEPPAEGTRL